MIKILHMGDVHLDTPFTQNDIRKAEMLRAELRGTFTSVMLYAKTSGIDIILIPGDLFDTRAVTKETVELVKREFEKIPECKIVIAPGNHDPCGPDSVYANTVFPENVYVFKTPELKRFVLDHVGAEDEKVDVYGWAFTGESYPEDPMEGMTVRDQSRINLICGHADLTSPSSRYAPVTGADLASSHIDYAAFGHIHNPQDIRKTGDTVYSYSGCLEGRDFTENGYKGVVIAEITKKDGAADVKARRLRFSKRRYESELLNVTGAESEEEIDAKIRSMLSEKKYGGDTALRIVIEGDVSPSVTVSEKRIGSRFAQTLFSLDVVDKTLPLYDFDALADDPTIRGAFFRQLLPMLKSEKEEDRTRAAHALRVGLAAIAGNDFTEI